MIDWKQHSQYVPLISGDSHSVMDQGFPKETGGEPTPAEATNLLFDMKNVGQRGRVRRMCLLYLSLYLSIFFTVLLILHFTKGQHS